MLKQYILLILSDPLYDAIFLDASYAEERDGLLAPVEQFRNEYIISKISDLLKENGSYLNPFSTTIYRCPNNKRYWIIGTS